MPLFIAALIGALASAAGHIVGRVLIALGIGYVSYTGVDTGMTFIKNYALTSIGTLPATMLGLIGVLKLGVVLNILMSACVAKMTLNGLTSGAIKKMVQK